MKKKGIAASAGGLDPGEAAMSSRCRENRISKGLPGHAPGVRKAHSLSRPRVVDIVKEDNAAVAAATCAPTHYILSCSARLGPFFRYTPFRLLFPRNPSRDHIPVAYILNSNMSQLITTLEIYLCEILRFTRNEFPHACGLGY